MCVLIFASVTGHKCKKKKKRILIVYPNCPLTYKGQGFPILNVCTIQTHIFTFFTLMDLELDKRIILLKNWLKNSSEENVFLFFQL